VFFKLSRSRLFLLSVTESISLTLRVPEISRFYGIIIRMFFNGHSPPHFHATGNVMNGELPARAHKLVQEWVELHRVELVKNYYESQKEGGIISKIEPLN
jgi:hypothetical protein